MPDLKRVAVLRAVGDANVGFAMRSLEGTAPELRVTLISVDIKSGTDLETAFANIKKSEAEALIAMAGGLTYTLLRGSPMMRSLAISPCVTRSKKPLSPED